MNHVRFSDEHFKLQLNKHVDLAKKISACLATLKFKKAIKTATQAEQISLECMQEFRDRLAVKGGTRKVRQETEEQYFRLCNMWINDLVCIANAQLNDMKLEATVASANDGLEKCEALRLQFEQSKQPERAKQVTAWSMSFRIILLDVRDRTEKTAHGRRPLDSLDVYSDLATEAIEMDKAGYKLIDGALPAALMHRCESSYLRDPPLLEEAIADAKAMVAIPKQANMSYFAGFACLSTAYMRAGQYDKAEEAVVKAARYDHGDNRSRMLCEGAMCRHLMGDYNRAYHLADQAIECSESVQYRLRALAEKARALWHIENKEDEAVELFREAIGLDDEYVRLLEKEDLTTRGTDLVQMRLQLLKSEGPLDERAIPYLVSMTESLLSGCAHHKVVESMRPENLARVITVAMTSLDDAEEIIFRLRLPPSASLMRMRADALELFGEFLFVAFALF
jgi:tetratricopeptide (TPR) repeat protein